LYRLLCVTAVVMAGNEFGKMQRSKKDKRRKKVIDMELDNHDDLSENTFDDELWTNYGNEGEPEAIAARRIRTSARCAPGVEESVQAPAITTCVNDLANRRIPSLKSARLTHHPQPARPRSRSRAIRVACLAAWLGIAVLMAGFGWGNHRGTDSPMPTTTSAAYQPQSSTPIESIHVGDRVMGNLSPGEMAGDTQVDPATWRHLSLHAEATWPDGTIDDIHVETLQPPEWVAQYEAEVGAEVPVPLDLVEMGLPVDLTARVITNEPCPSLKPGPGRVVLTTVNHLNSDIYELTVATADGHIETIRPTGFHKFYRPIDAAWVAAKDLRPGDGLEGASGPVVVRSVEKLPGAQRVYNMTVEGEHVYRVSLLGALVHNNCPHLNSRVSSVSNEGYAIINKTTGEVYKFGVTARGVDTRFAEQADRIANLRGVSASDLEAVKLRDFTNRADALKWEKETVGFFRGLGHDLPNNLRPTGIPFVQ